MKLNNQIRLGLIFLAVFFLNKVHAQQQVMFSQYMFNAMAINPGYVGSSEALSITALTRHQWVGIEGAPMTQTLSAHTPIQRKGIAVGGLFLRDQIGVSIQNAAFAYSSYRIKFLNKSTLSMGLGIGFSDYKAINSQVYTGSANDPNFLNNDIRGFSPNIGSGLYFSTARFYAGISSPFLLNTFYGDKNSATGIEHVRHYFVMAGYVFDLSPAVKFKPNSLVKVVEGAPIQVDLNANFLLDDLFWVGLSWRSFDSIDLIFEVQISNNLKMGYAYDMTTTNLRKVNNGTHELMLNYVLGFSKNRVVTPRYF